MDEELGEAWARVEREDVETPPMSPEGYTPEIARLDRLIDLIKESIRVSIAAAGGKANPIPPEPRPETAEQRARKKFDREEVESVLAQLGVR
ncbi:hypothetical protein QNA24_30250 [Rhodococcus qingshengii]|uniref:hypothetical protein n=1 Tax=Rhodococcus TaxID=1827 RepID=UPI001E65C992|nr:MULTISPECIES: hypothetical protein [Rhodococcus]MCD2099532.1 hypothetical protein [Rhodococcus rhodochrous]MCD2123900.1 hypothetical protein [Rhodococcus rhodochrous]MCQ4136673.1 hypothetical protein [Rhodococcus rhodochrous]MDJ0490666.1 hypothetical protein [Rhodococcus qingshengii]